MDCLDNIIGLSETTCNCYPDAPTDYNTSRSGIFLDRLEGLNLETIKAANDCASGGLWDRMSQAVEDAKLQFVADLLGCVQKNYKPKRDVWAGLFGETNFTANLAITEQWAGIRTKAYNIKGGVFMLRQIGVLVDTTGPVTVEIWSNENGGTQIDSFTVNAVANTLTYGAISPEPLALPMWSTNRTDLRYYFIYNNDGSFIPKNNKKDCGCGGNANKEYLEWADFSGIRGADPNSIDAFKEDTKYMNGLVLDIEMKCRNSEIICSDDHPLDFADDGAAMNMAYAIRFKAGEILIDQILSSGNVNRYTLMNREALYGKREHFRVKYDEWILYLCTNPNIQFNDCLMCRDTQMIKTGIKA